MGLEEKQNAVNLVKELEDKKRSLTAEISSLNSKVLILSDRVRELRAQREDLKKDVDAFTQQRAERRGQVKITMANVRKISDKLRSSEEALRDVRAARETEIQSKERAIKEKEKTEKDIEKNLEKLNDRRNVLSIEEGGLNKFADNLKAKERVIYNGIGRISGTESDLKILKDQIEQDRVAAKNTLALLSYRVKELEVKRKSLRAKEEELKNLESELTAVKNKINEERELLVQERAEVVNERAINQGILVSINDEKRNLESGWKEVEVAKKQAEYKKLNVLKILHDRGLDDIIEIVKEIK